MIQTNMLDMRNIQKKNVELYVVQPHTDKIIFELRKSEFEVYVPQKSGKKYLDKLQKWSIIASVAFMKRSCTDCRYSKEGWQLKVL